MSSDETIARYGILVNPPGEVFEYSNLGFGILDHIVTRASGMDYADYMRQQVFIPLGMMRTSVGIAPGLEPYAAQRYDSRQRPMPFYDFNHRGAGAVYASAHDLVRFGMFHLKDHLSDQHAILKDETIDLMHRPVPPAEYGFGWAVTADDNGYLRYSHTGGMPGVATVELAPDALCRVAKQGASHWGSNVCGFGVIVRICCGLFDRGADWRARAGVRLSPAGQQGPSFVARELLAHVLRNNPLVSRSRRDAGGHNGQNLRHHRVSCLPVPGRHASSRYSFVAALLLPELPT
jgi:Beta-lactamase